MAPLFGDSALPSRRSREAARRRRKIDRERALKLESLEPRLALAVMPGLSDTIAPVVRSVALPAAGTYGTGKPLTFKVNFSEPVNVFGKQSDVFLPIEVGYAMRTAQYVSGSGTRSLTFRMNVAANDVDTDGISLGRVNADAIRDFDFAAGQIRDRVGNAASNAIPAVNTSRIRVDATGPVVAAYSGFATSIVYGRKHVSLKVTFDGPVTVTGRPMVPVTIDGKQYNLSYVAGSKTSTLTFAVTVAVPKDDPVENPAFRGTKNLPGEVILLPKGADLKDRFGNAVTPIGGNFGKAFTDDAGNRVVVIGTHYEKLKIGTSESVSQEELNMILNREQDDFRFEEVEQIKNGQADYWKNYVSPVFERVNNDVELYRVAYRSTIPEQGNRPTVAYGLVAIPKGATGSLPLVSYQHGTLVMKESAPSQAFSWDKNSMAPAAFGLPEKLMYASAYETRLNVARFAGNGYAVIAADYFGIGNSVENDSFFVKGSAQQANLDMYAAAQKLLASQNLAANKLFLNGWSQGGVVTVAFQEALEARGVKIDGVSTAAAPADTEMLVNRMLFNPRPYSTETAPDAAWVVMIPQLAAFSLGGYGGKPGTALELFGGNYDFARKFYMREFKSIPGFAFQEDVRGDMKPVMTMDGDTRSAQPSEFIVQRFGQDPRAYEKTTFAGLMRDAGGGKTRLESTMKMYYGTADDGSPDTVATIVPTWQQGTFGKKNIELVPVADASHRDGVLSAAYGQLGWFDKIRKGESTTGVGSPNPVTGVPAAVVNLTATPVRTGEVLLNWSPAAGATSYKLLLNGQTVFDRFNETYRFFDKLSPATTYTFTVVPVNASGSGPETEVVFGPAVVDLAASDMRMAMTAGLDGSIWVGSLTVGADGGFLQQVVKNAAGTWTAQSPISVDVTTALTTDLDGSIWVACNPTQEHPDQGTVQHIVQENGIWVRKEVIKVDKFPSAITTGKDGAIWVISQTSNIDPQHPATVQRIVRDQNGNWFVRGEPLSVDDDPRDITAGLDGSIWVACQPGILGDGTGTVQRIVEFDDGTWNVLGAAMKVDNYPISLTTGTDGAIWVGCHPSRRGGPGAVQRIVNENGQWFVKGSAISVDGTPDLTTGVDGSIWVGSHSVGTIQHIVNERGTWFVQGDPIQFGMMKSLTTGLDGSIWVTVRDDSTASLRQVWTNPASPSDLSAVVDPAAGKATLSWKAPAANGGTPVLSYAVTARQGATITTATDWDDNAHTFSGLDFSKGPIFFTVAATNFAGTSPVATLLVGQDGKLIDTTSLTIGIATDGTSLVAGGGFDSVGNTYSWQALGSGVGVGNGDATFTFGLPNQPQTIVSAGQEIAVTQGAFGSVNLAGAAVYYGAQPNLVFTLNYTDSTTETWTQSFSDWAQPRQYAGETTLVTMPYRNQGDGTKDSRPVYLYGYSRAIPQGKTLKSITLPTNLNVRILDIKMGT